LPAGNYRVTVNNPSGFTPTQTQPNAIALATGQNVDTVDFGFTQQQGTLGDTVYNDTNGNNTQDTGEAGINNVTLNLIGAGPDGQFGTPDDITRTTTTDSNGRYSFPGLPAGNYRVTVNNPSGFTPTQTQPNAIALATGQNVDTVDFGFTGQGSIGDTVFNDTNANGVQDQGEPGIGGVTINLTDSSGNVVTTTSNSSGNYSFPNLTPGNYTVSIPNPPAGFNPTLVPSSISLQPGQNFDTADFGFTQQPRGTIGDTVFSDRNDNGVQDQREPGISGVSVNLTGAGPDGQFGTADDITRPAITTDSNGIYRFINLPAGNYRVSINPPSNLPQVTTTGGTQQERNLQPGQTLDNVDFGLRGGAVGAANTALRLVKRITNVLRNGQPVNGINFSGFVDDPSDNNDNLLQQAGRPPVGVYQIETPLQSGDEVEYTIYYLAEGDQDLQNVSFCDLIPPETSYSSGEISVNRAGATSLLTNAEDSDQGTFYTPLRELPPEANPNRCPRNQTNTKGAVIVNLGTITITPDRNFGFLRFRVRID
ncbi:MAG: carboxypeptidase regulatory-like domain-containing protein, partial [Spirirestis rafaelensis WJT71-NPBG6]|jgi:uncharacterized repeat protein (TIGR01451 family)|nr:carboxypeptidase regulatory-like domain-containing protein [Spirirestis rafaelensis WJT71-NPBG6]